MSEAVSGRIRDRDERGASSVEYGLMISAIAAVIALTVYYFGDNVFDLFTETCQTMVSANGSGSCH
jgi:Flp pilus assembly pilin Flp